MRFAVDTGGTFTDLVIEENDGRQSVYKSPTVPADPVQGVLDVFGVAAAQRGVPTGELLGAGSMLIHGTTRAINAVLTGRTARTAFLTTEGHPDVLVLREGHRAHVFDFTVPYPEPYVPRSLTFEVPERIDRDGDVVAPLDEAAVLEVVERLRAAEVEAVGVCLLWSIVNPAHERRVGELLAEHLPGVAVTLSHQLNRSLREYRRASSTVIDASLKPIMSSYLGSLDERLRAAGFDGRLLVVISSGALLDSADVAAAPVHSLNSGPAMAPVAGRHFVEVDAANDTAIVADTGGTSYDVSVVRRGRIPRTQETWLGEQLSGHITGFPSIDVKSVGAGGGSIAWIDAGGLLHVGPQSAAADPGPVCYGRGGTEPTVTDACLALGLLDADYFLGGTMKLDAAAARASIEAKVAGPLGLEVEEAAAAIVKLATERMVSAIEEITIHQGIDPRRAVLIGGGGAAGFNTVAIAARLGCPEVLVPTVGPALSAAGALISDLARDFEVAFRTDDLVRDRGRVAEVLGGLERECQEFIRGAGAGAIGSAVELSAEAHYPHQIWELDVPLRNRLDGPEAVAAFHDDFHDLHEEVFSIADRGAAVEVERWHARARCRLHEVRLPDVTGATGTTPAGKRRVFFPDHGWVDAAIWRIDDVAVGTEIAGPAIVESPLTTVVIDVGAAARRLPTGTLAIAVSAPSPTAQRAEEVLA